MPEFLYGIVLSLSPEAFSGCSSLVSVIIGTGVTSIGSSAFFGCASLASITIPNNVTNIGTDAFQECYSLASITIGNGVTSIGDAAFENSDSLTAVTIGTGVTSIGSSAFFGCASLASITIPNNVTNIGTEAFSGCSSLVSVIIGTGVTSIGSSAFFGCASLASITIPNNVTNIGTDAFQECYSLASITMGNGVTSIGYGTFSGCISLTSVTIPNSVTTFGEDFNLSYDEGSVFLGCISLTNVIFGTGLTSIGANEFYGCRSLTSITIPSNVTYLGVGAFGFCTNLVRIYFLGNAPGVSWGFVRGSLGELEEIGTFMGDNETISVYYLSGTTGWPSNFGPVSVWDYVSDNVSMGFISYVINGNQIAITDGIGAPNTVTIPSSIFSLPVTSIAEQAFAGLTNLTAITVDSQNVAYSTLNGALFDKTQTALLEVPPGTGGSYVIPNSVTNIGAGAFSQCHNLTNIIILASVNTIGSEAFVGCANLLTFTVDPQNPNYSSVNGVLFDKTQATLVAYPAGISGIYTVPSSVTNIGYGAFLQCPSLTAVTLPNSVTSISGEALAGCAALTNVTAGNGLSSLGEQVFSNCTSLRSIYFLGNAPSADSSAFAGDNATIYFLFGTTGWSSTFAGLSSVLLPFNYSTSGNAITITGYTGSDGAAKIPGSINGLPVGGIGANALSNYSILTMVMVPNSITSIGSGAFQSCTNLTSVFFTGPEPGVDSTVFDSDPNVTIYNLLTGDILTYAVLNISNSPSGGISVATVANWTWGPITGPINVDSDGAITISGNLGSQHGIITAGSGGILNLTSGTILNPINAANGATVNWSGGDIAGAGVNVADGAILNWSSGGQMNCPVTIASNGVANITGVATKFLFRPLTNWGTVNLSGACTFLVYNNEDANYTAGIYNQPGALWDFQVDGTMSGGYSFAFFNNAGTVRKSGGTGTTSFDYQLPFNNYGTLSVLQGSISFQGGGTLAGVYSAALGTTINFSGGPFSYATVPVLDGAGTIKMTGGSLTLLDDAIPNLQMAGGTITLTTNFQGGVITNLTLIASTLSGDHSVSGVFNCGGGTTGSLQILPGATVNWSGGDIAGAGVNVADGAILNWSSGGQMNCPVTIASNGVANITGVATKFLFRPLTNWGTVNLSGACTFLVYNNEDANYTAGIYNQPGALWDFQVDGTMSGGYSFAFFNNAGTVRKSGGTGTTSFDYQLPFNNYGTLSVLQGSISFQGGLALIHGTLNFGLISSSSFGQINISGNATLSGTVSATLLGGFVPISGNSFPVLAYGSSAGVFTNVILPPEFVCSTNYSATKFTLTVLGIRPVVAPTIVMSGTPNQATEFNLQFTGSTNTTYTVMASTNLAIPLSNWVTLGNAALLSSNVYQFIDTNSTNLPGRFYMLRSP